MKRLILKDLFDRMEKEYKIYMSTQTTQTQLSMDDDVIEINEMISKPDTPDSEDLDEVPFKLGSKDSQDLFEDRQSNDDLVNDKNSSSSKNKQQETDKRIEEEEEEDLSLELNKKREFMDKEKKQDHEKEKEKEIFEKNEEDIIESVKELEIERDKEDMMDFEMDRKEDNNFKMDNVQSELIHIPESQSEEVDSPIELNKKREFMDIEEIKDDDEKFLEGLERMKKQKKDPLPQTYTYTSPFSKHQLVDNDNESENENEKNESSKEAVDKEDFSQELFVQTSPYFDTNQNIRNEKKTNGHPLNTLIVIDDSQQDIL